MNSLNVIVEPNVIVEFTNHLGFEPAWSTWKMAWHLKLNFLVREQVFLHN